MAFETSGEACSCALWLDGECREAFEVAPRRHGERVLPMAQGLLAEAGLAVRELDALAFGRGPGSFTGVRVAVGVVQGIGYAADLPVVPVSTLLTLAQGGLRVHGWDRVLAVQDARMGEVYWCPCTAPDGTVMTPAGPERVGRPRTVVAPDGPWWGVGTGWAAYGAELKGPTAPRGLDPAWLPHAADVARLAVAAWERGEGVAAHEAAPVYLRDHVADPQGGRAD